MQHREEEDDLETYYSEGDDTDLTRGTDRLRERLNKIELANQKFNQYAERLAKLSQQQEQYDDDDSFGEGEDRHHHGYVDEEEEDLLSVASSEIHSPVVEKPRKSSDEGFLRQVHKNQSAKPLAFSPPQRFKNKHTYNNNSSDYEDDDEEEEIVPKRTSRRTTTSNEAMEAQHRREREQWEAEEKELRKELVIAKRRTQRTELLLKQAEAQNAAMQTRLNKANKQIQELRMLISHQQPPLEQAPKPPTTRKNRVEEAKRLLKEAGSIESRFLTLAKKDNTQSQQQQQQQRTCRPPFVPGGNSLVSQNRLVPVKDYSTQLAKLQEKKRVLDDEYRALLRYGAGEAQDILLASTLDRIRELERRIARAKGIV